MHNSIDCIHAYIHRIYLFQMLARDYRTPLAKIHPKVPVHVQIFVYEIGVLEYVYVKLVSSHATDTGMSHVYVCVCTRMVMTVKQDHKWPENIVCFSHADVYMRMYVCICTYNVCGKRPKMRWLLSVHTNTNAVHTLSYMHNSLHIHMAISRETRLNCVGCRRYYK